MFTQKFGSHVLSRDRGYGLVLAIAPFLIFNLSEKILSEFSNCLHDIAFCWILWFFMVHSKVLFAILR